MAGHPLHLAHAWLYCGCPAGVAHTVARSLRWGVRRSASASASSLRKPDSISWRAGVCLLVGYLVTSYTLCHLQACLTAWTCKPDLEAYEVRGASWPQTVACTPYKAPRVLSRPCHTAMPEGPCGPQGTTGECTLCALCCCAAGPGCSRHKRMAPESMSACEAWVAAAEEHDAAHNSKPWNTVRGL